MVVLYDCLKKTPKKVEEWNDENEFLHSGFMKRSELFYLLAHSNEVITRDEDLYGYMLKVDKAPKTTADSPRSGNPYDAAAS
ncbi:hypothetical protein [Hydrogenimonas urashimensis]|uniref:hypothetical protein n=1 Tax=Hydrogenimonas urashimensis TaxID=2740515 RepID=UPI0019156A91|nr:hypothetical protein [Hydrogenimonas urashimensis]